MAVLNGTVWDSGRKDINGAFGVSGKMGAEGGWKNAVTKGVCFAGSMYFKQKYIHKCTEVTRGEMECKLKTWQIWC